MKRVTNSDFIIIGGGIAGASIAYWLAPHAEVVLLEREFQPGYHATARSAALFAESYGPEQVRALTRASRTFLEDPPPGFADHPLLTPRGMMFVARGEQLEELQALYANCRAQSTAVHWLDGAQARARVPVLRSEHAIAAVLDMSAADIDVNELLQGFMRGARQAGARTMLDAGVQAMEYDGAAWRVDTATASYRAAVVVNAAGAWADEIGRMAGAAPISLEPRRRSAFTFSAPSETVITDWPAVINVAEDYYFKPDAGVLLGSCANADPAPPTDVQPEEFDIALGIHEIEQATTLAIRRPLRTWAGLRSFVPSGNLVGGYDKTLPGFFWLAGQGGYGIQSCAAMGQACAALALGHALPETLLLADVRRDMFLPGLAEVNKGGQRR